MTQDKNWTEFYTEENDLMYPAEAVIRIFKGAYPSLDLGSKFGERGGMPDLILDVGFGDGRHFPLFRSLGMECYGTEVTDRICDTVSKKMRRMGVPAALKSGTCSNLPWSMGLFDFVLAWNSCYYMSLGTGKFADHVAELARVMVDGGYLICSVPTERCFIFNGSEPCADPKYHTIMNDHFGIRDGETMRLFRSQADIEDEFGAHFEDFRHATIDIDMFGLPYSWYVFVAKRRARLA